MYLHILSTSGLTVSYVVNSPLASFPLWCAQGRACVCVSVCVCVRVCVCVFCVHMCTYLTNLCDSFGLRAPSESRTKMADLQEGDNYIILRNVCAMVSTPTSAAATRKQDS